MTQTLRATCVRHKKEYEVLKANHELEIDSLKSNATKVRDYLMLEIKCLEETLNVAKVEREKMIQEIRELKAILRTPRLNRIFCEKHNKFIHQSDHYKELMRQ